MKYKGSCHCGRVAFEVEGEIKGAMACNCSICQRKGSLLWFVPRAQLQLLTPEGAASLVPLVYLGIGAALLVWALGVEVRRRLTGEARFV